MYVISRLFFFFFFVTLQALETDMTFICPTSGMPRKGTLPAGISEDLLREAPNLATALKQVEEFAQKKKKNVHVHVHV